MEARPFKDVEHGQRVDEHGQREIMTLQSERHGTNEQARKATDGCGRRNTDPRSDVSFGEQKTDGISAETEKDGMTKGNEPGIA